MEHLSECNQLNIRLEQAHSKIKSYETLEVEFDQTIAIAAATDHNNDQTTSPLVVGFPTNPHHRMKQAIFLSKKLLESEKQREAAVQEIQQLKSAVERAEKEILSLQTALTRSSQPTSYLINKLREEETLKTTLLEENKNKNKEIIMWKTRFLDCRKDFLDLQERLQLLLKQRGELETVKTMIAHLHDLDGDDEDEEDEAERRERMKKERLEKLIGDIPPSPLSLPPPEAAFPVSFTREESSPIKSLAGGSSLEELAARLKLPVEAIKRMVIRPQKSVGSVDVTRSFE
jgi:hypothetical protein